MPRDTRIAQRLKDFGLKVEVVPGWETRGNATFNPRGVVCHWTAGPRGTKGRPSLNVVVNGRPGLNGPLCNVYLDRDGVAVVVAAGRANHAGSGGWKGLVGNASVFGIEGESAGDGDWTPAQRREYPKVAAALTSLTPTQDVGLVCGHNEWTPSRKIDIRDWPMSKMRSQVADILDPKVMEMIMSWYKDKAEFERAIAERVLREGIESRNKDENEGKSYRLSTYVANDNANLWELRRVVDDLSAKVDKLLEAVEPRPKG